MEDVAITAPIIEDDERGGPDGRLDLANIDFEKLAKLFLSRPRTANEQMRAKAQSKVQQLVQANPTRLHLAQKLDAEAFVAALKGLVEQLTEGELAIFDLLTRPAPKLSTAQDAEVKQVARGLLDKLQALQVEFWRQHQQTRAQVYSEIRLKRNELPEAPYPQATWDNKVEAVWQFVYRRGVGVSGSHLAAY